VAILQDIPAIHAAFAEAPFDQDAWTPALELVTQVTGAWGAGLIPVRGRVPGFPVTESARPLFAQYIAEGWYRDDFRERGIPHMLRTGVTTDLDFVTPEQIAHIPYYQDLLRPHGNRWFAGIVLRADEDLWCLSLYRTAEQGPFVAEEREQLRKLVQPLSAVAQLSRKVAGIRVAGMIDGLAAIGLPALLLDRYGRVLRMNPDAEAILPSGFKIANGTLVARERHSAARLASVIARTLHSPEAAIPPPVAIVRQRGRPLAVQVLPILGEARAAFAQAKLLLTIVDPDSRAVSTEAHLQSVFGLTAAEARLAVRLSRGQNLKEVADELEIGKETARTQLRSVFIKTETARQAELVAVLARLAGGLPGRRE
jgi:DNA-binding CsgD family transcriptional regulator